MEKLTKLHATLKSPVFLAIQDGRLSQRKDHKKSKKEHLLSQRPLLMSSTIADTVVLIYLPALKPNLR